MFKAFYLFYVFKFAPMIIDNNTNKFWRNSVALLNSQRQVAGDVFYLWKYGRLYIRNPNAIPMKLAWTSSRYHPFCWRKNKIFIPTI